MNWVSIFILDLLDKADCVTYCRIEDRKHQQVETLKQLYEQIETLVGKGDRSSKIRPLVKRYNQGMDSLDKLADQEDKCLLPTAMEQLRKRQR